MSIELFFLGCFAFGTLFTLAMGVLGAIGVTADVDVPHHHGTGPLPGHGPDVHLPILKAGDVPTFWHLLNTSSILAFLMFFGALGYLTLRAGHVLWLACAAALASGLAAAWGMAWVLQFLKAGTRYRSAAEDRPEGTLASVSVGVPENGVGEVVFTVGGIRRNEAARCPSGLALPRETEVLITGYEHGVALVEPWNRVLRQAGESAPTALPEAPDTHRIREEE